MQRPSSTQIADDADGRQRGVEVAEPGAGDAAEADRGEDLVDEPGRGQQPAPHDAGRDERDDLRQEQHRPGGGPEPPGRDPVDHARDDAARAPTGMKLKKTISLKALTIDLEQVGVAQDRA